MAGAVELPKSAGARVADVAGGARTAGESYIALVSQPVARSFLDFEHANLDECIGGLTVGCHFALKLVRKNAETLYVGSGVIGTRAFGITAEMELRGRGNGQQQLTEEGNHIPHIGNGAIKAEGSPVASGAVYHWTVGRI